MKSKKLAIALASIVAFLSGCGSSGGGTAVTTSPSNIIGCSQYSGSTCIAPIYGTGGCVPISQPIYFGGTGQSNGNVLLAGQIPGYGTFGNMTVSSSAVSGGTGTPWTSPSGLTMYTATSGSSTSVYGQMVLSQAVQQNILMNIGYYAGYGSSYGTSSACVSGIGLQVAPYYSVQGVYGYVYLYLNGSTQHGYYVQIY